MNEKRHIESILRVNGITSAAPDEEIKTILLSARFNDAEADTALVILRENARTSDVTIDGLHKVFRTDTALKPAEVSQLLGIDYQTSGAYPKRTSGRDSSFFELILLSLASSLVAIVCLLMYMYSENVGLFHPSAEPVMGLTKST
ncbi:MAG: hypothetical protein AAB618_00610 [Patescibacteria group bacterium]